MEPDRLATLKLESSPGRDVIEACDLTPDGTDAIAMVFTLQVERRPVYVRDMPCLASLFHLR